MPAKNLYFFIGTDAEFIKEICILKELQARRINYKLILTGQNDITKSVFYPDVKPEVEKITLSKEALIKDVIAYLLWFFRTFIKALIDLRAEFKGLVRKDTYIFVHGDTLTALLGAVVAKLYGLKLVHVEAGYRSSNFLQPFPEEICRYLVSFLADVHFVAYDGLLKNIKHRRGLKVSTKYNTFIDSLNYALEQKCQTSFSQEFASKQYFILLCHRQENIYNRAFMAALVDAVVKQSKQMTCLFVLHESTEAALKKHGLLDQVKQSPNIVISPRLPYFDFIKVLENAQFIMSDGGGNQQECYYWGKPILILRNVTEGSEGVGENALLLKGDFAKIGYFMENYKEFRRGQVAPEKSPSSIIVDYVQKL